MRTFGVDWYHHLPLHVKGILETLQGAGFEAYLAGGAVRDLWLGLEPKDFDIASSATPDEIEKLFPRTEGVGKQFGIMIVVTEEGPVEVARFRADAEYKDGRHPTSVEFSSPEEDAKRRDFTLNALFYCSKARQVIDYVGGVSDIEARIIRCVGDAQKRFEEDSLRMLRAVRFHSQLAERGFALDPSLLEAIRAQASRLSLVSRERITQEVSKIFATAMPSLGLRDLLEAELWQPVFSAAPPGDLTKFDLVAPAKLPLMAAAASRWIQGWNAEASFVLTKEAKAAIREVPQLCQVLGRYGALSLAEKKGILAATFFPEACAILQAEGAAVSQAKLDQASWQKAGTLDPAPLLKGADILAAGVPAGPRVKELLSRLRQAQLNEEISSSTEAFEMLKNLV